MSSCRSAVLSALAAAALFAGAPSGAWAAAAAPVTAPAPAAAATPQVPPSGWPPWPQTLPQPNIPAAGVNHYGYGSVPTPQQIAGWAIAVRPDGQGLPPGHGNVTDGGNVYAQQCAACHGTFGEGEGNYPKLANGSALTVDQPTLTVGNYWPFATTLWDYIDRAMPFPAPHSLTPDQVYAITAYVLNLNNIVPASFVADRHSLPLVKMPNRHGFIWRDPRPDTLDTACMKNCRNPADVKIVSTAEGKPLTPRTSGPLDTMQPK